MDKPGFFSERLSDCSVAIVGLGLMGGSLALALRGFCRELLGIDPDPATAALAQQMRLVDRFSPTPEPLLPEADIVILAAPVGVILDQIARLPQLHPGQALVLDLGSTKSEIMRAMQALPARFDPLGGHPMTGKERSSLREAEAGLYHGAPFAFTPLERTSPRARALGEQIARCAGAQPLWLEAGQHDRLASAVSHVPFLAANALAAVTPDEASVLVGPGFRSTTRVAATPDSMIVDVLLTNRENVLSGLRDLRAQLGLLEAALQAGDEAGLRTLIRAGAQQRSRLVTEKAP